MNRKHKLYVGIDAHRSVHRAALIPLGLLEQPGLGWRRIKPIDIENNRDDFESLLSSIMLYVSCIEDVTIAIDYVGRHYSEPLLYFLASRGFKVHFLEPRGVKAARERLFDEESKTDSIDARYFAYLLYLRDVHSFSFRISDNSPEFGSMATALRSLILQKEQINKMVVQATNRLHQYLLAVFPEGEARYHNQLLKLAEIYPTPEDMLNDNLKLCVRMRKTHREELLSMAANTVGIPGTTYRWIIREIARQRNIALENRDALNAMITEKVTEHPYACILRTFPRLGDTAAASIIGVIKDIERWPDKRALRKALGVYSSGIQSGNSRYRSRKGKEGDRLAKKALYQVCITCMIRSVPDNDFRDYYLKQVAKGKPKMKAIVSTMGKLAELIFHCLKFNEPYTYKGLYRRKVQM